MPCIWGKRKVSPTCAGVWSTREARWRRPSALNYSSSLPSSSSSSSSSLSPSSSSSSSSAANFGVAKLPNLPSREDRSHGGESSHAQSESRSRGNSLTLMDLEDWHFTWETVAVWFMFAITARRQPDPEDAV